jgi:hypothetical protein
MLSFGGVGSRGAGARGPARGSLPGEGPAYLANEYQPRGWNVR